MAEEKEDELNWKEDAVQDVRNIYPSKPVFERASPQWQHTPDAEVTPWWVLPATAIAILVLGVLVVHAQMFLINN